MVMTFGGQTVLRNVTRATLTPVLPRRGKATGAAVVIAPGGGFLMLSMDSEGWREARWLADHGVAAFVLKYRLRPTSAEPAGFFRELGALMRRPPLKLGEELDQGVSEDAVQDGLAAMRLVKARAADWGVDPERVGMLDFSAGAMTTLQVALRYSREAMPTFIALIYPPMNASTVPASAPPMFVAITQDDPLFGHMGYGLVQA
jgi:acetyl esterase/lipase